MDHVEAEEPQPDRPDPEPGTATDAVDGSGAPPAAEPVPERHSPSPAPALPVLFVLLLGLFGFLALWPLLAPTVLAATAAVVLSPTCRRLQRRLGGGRNRAAFTTLLLVTAFLGAPLFGAAVLFVSQAKAVLEDFIGMPTDVALTTGFSRLVDQYLEWLEGLGGRYFSSAFDFREIAEARLHLVGRDLYESLPDVLEWASRLAIGFVVFHLVLYFLLRDGDRALALLRQVSPLEGRHSEQILARLGGVVRAAFLGGVVTALFQATVGALGFLLTGFESFVIWGVLLLVASFVPVLGTALVWAPVVLYLAFTGSPGRALFLLGVGLLISTADNFLRIALIGRQTALHPAVLFLGVFGGLATAGPMGLVYGILLAAALSEVTDIYRSEVRGRGTAA